MFAGAAIEVGDEFAGGGDHDPVESGLSVAAGAQIASLMDHVDLDGNLLLAYDPWPGVEFADGVQLPSNDPGLGVREAIPDPR